MGSGDPATLAGIGQTSPLWSGMALSAHNLHTIPVHLQFYSSVPYGGMRCAHLLLQSCFNAHDCCFFQLSLAIELVSPAGKEAT